LLSYITGSSPKFFQPSNINFALFPPIIPKVRERKIRREMIVERAIDAWLKYLKLIG
jgi:methylenetetrahydrofolate--tRNA-(uracil-5-)-methyltransferase